MDVAASDARLAEARGGGWWFTRWSSPSIAAGLTDRSCEPSQLLAAFRAPVTAAAEQVHGGSVAVMGSRRWRGGPIPGADALVTSLPGVALLIRTADCLPIFFADPARRAIGLAHAGWRGLAAGLPARVVAAMRRTYRTRSGELAVAIGPAIRACCYDVGPEFEARFGPFVRTRGGRRTCDLVGAAVDQLRRCGVRPERILDSQVCTACEVHRWFSLRREGPATGRLTSLIVVRP
jgi:YfiH family protein